jgi:hypothetical protein
MKVLVNQLVVLLAAFVYLLDWIIVSCQADTAELFTYLPYGVLSGDQPLSCKHIPQTLACAPSLGESLTP